MADETIAVGSQPGRLDAFAFRVRIGQTIGYYLAFITLGMTFAAVGPTIASLAAQTQSQVSQISWILWARWLGYLVGSYVGGRLYDRARGQLVMAGMLLVMAVTMALVPGIPLLWALVIVMVAWGVGGGAVDVGGNTLLMWVHGEKVGPFMNALHFFYGLGAFIGPLIVAQTVLRTGDVRWAYWGIALLALPAIAWNLLMPSPARRIADAAGVAVSFNSRLVVLFSAFFFLIVSAESGFADWISPYAMAQGLSQVNAAYVASAFWGALTLGRLLFIPIAAHVKASTVLLINVIGCVMGAGLILAAQDSVVALVAGAIIFGISVSVLFPSAMTLASTRMQITGRVTGWFLVGASLGGMSMPKLIGQLFETVGAWTAIAVVLAASLAMLAVFPTLARGGRLAPEGRL